ncbi:MAG: Inorganic diphosphatase PpaC [uncultured bacterium]|nr:MAG: Inorganic diphosphatase PpaC [uncultured bacterium]
MNKIVVIGHKNPDTDSIISALVGAEYLEKVLGKNAKAYRAGILNNETKFILEKWEVEIPEEINPSIEIESVCLVDHNEVSQLAEGVDYNKVDFVIDHHKVAITTEKPFFMRLEPIGSTSSLLAKMFFEKGEFPSEVTSKLLLSGILSDTLNFTSPTTTQEDKEFAQKLNEIAKLDVESYVAEMFKAKSSLEGISTEEITTLDYKEFEMGNKKVGVGTWETTLPQSVNERKEEIFKILSERKESKKLDYIYFMVVDIIAGNCQLYIISDEEKTLAEKVFGESVENGIMLLKGVVSRKKQIVPPLTEALS